MDLTAGRAWNCNHSKEGRICLIGGGIRARSHVQGLDELVMKRRRLGAERLKLLAVGGEHRRNGRWHLVLSGVKNPRRRGQRDGVGRA